ncbi:MAG TPA: hypothetical protein VE954_40915 [Oligoflexus sp.]|uniref:hypothetical protein n=1 Tax=Oligoflexus sp. TaxID=1971216 RepID=UPI002D625D1E|nr:hypothetical protein [Oligoflexus sp.]HYX39503.1 hypothetical protein [Oligoflexus sp.]
MLRLRTGFLAVLLMVGCQPLYKAERNYEVYEKDQEFFQPLLNGSTDDVDAKATVVLEDQSYPIQLQLYQDGRFFYHLKRLGDGWGTWSHKNGFLHLYAERKLFVMNLEIHSIQQDGNALSLEFSDRFGPKFLRLQKTLK